MSISTVDDFGSGWTAIGVAGSWLLLEPCEASGDSRPHELADHPRWCIVTSDNPEGRTRSEAENVEGRKCLWSEARTRTTAPFETCGGIGSVGDPTRWPAGESGVAIPVASVDDAVKLCQMFHQAAVYLLVGDERHLIDREGRLVCVQRYRTHCVSLSTPPLGPEVHTPSCLCSFVRYDESPFVDWSCVWGEVWGSAQIEGFGSQPVRVFYGVHQDGRPVLLRSEPDAALSHLVVGMTPSDARGHAVSQAQEWGLELEERCPTSASR
jgi:hypothetical protein